VVSAKLALFGPRLLRSGHCTGGTATPFICPKPAALQNSFVTGAPKSLPGLGSHGIASAAGPITAFPGSELARQRSGVADSRRLRALRTARIPTASLPCRTLRRPELRRSQHGPKHFANVTFLQKCSSPCGLQLRRRVVKNEAHRQLAANKRSRRRMPREKGSNLIASFLAWSLILWPRTTWFLFMLALVQN